MVTLRFSITKIFDYYSFMFALLLKCSKGFWKSVLTISKSKNFDET